tara:strand:- start:438 stop:809 length:372 start_codon:yes stop_codon:yes gene_type:complete
VDVANFPKTDEGTLDVTTVTVDDDRIALNFDGTVGKYGKVFVTIRLTATNPERDAGRLEGSARTIIDDGAVITATLAGSWRRDRTQLKFFFVDNCSNGDQNFVTFDVDLGQKTSAVTVYSTLS